MSNASNNIYESHDIEVGRATTVEDIGFRFQVDSDGYTGTPGLGTFCAVSDKTGAEGKLFDIVGKPNSEAGNYEVVARVEEVGTDYRVFRTVSPRIETLV
jgi:hypothetical protein